MLASSVLVTLAGLVSFSTAGYVLEDDYSVDQFFSMFDFFTDADPTNGYVQYVSQSTAQSGGLINTNNNAVYMGVDYTNVASGSGRQSVRLTSKKSYTHGLIILDLSHMPGGVCGTWPAFWTVGPNWPGAGEIDIIEGVNSQAANSMALHTGSGCSISNTGLFSGSISTSNCFVDAAGQPGNAGCQILTGNDDSYGSGFNNGQGGVYATEWTSSGINIWFFPRSAVPADISAGSPDTSGWGQPMASFGSGGCDIDDFFMDHQIVFDTTFCGDWAGNVWSDDATCGSKAATCQDFVQNNPSAFQDAYWSVNSLKVYQSNGASSSGTPSSSGFPFSSIVPTVSVPLPSGGASSAPWPATAATSSAWAGGSGNGGGDGRHTRAWGTAANFVADSASTPTATSSESLSFDPSAPTATTGPAMAVAVASDGSMSEVFGATSSSSATTAPPADITPAPTPAVAVVTTEEDDATVTVTETDITYTTVSALGDDYFQHDHNRRQLEQQQQKEQKKRSVGSAFVVSEPELALEPRSSSLVHGAGLGLEGGKNLRRHVARHAARHVRGRWVVVDGGSDE